MNETHAITTALERRFAREPVPACPDRVWSPTTRAIRPRVRHRGFAYAAMLLVALGVAGMTAQASGVLATSAGFMGSFFNGSAKPPGRIIHQSDQLTVAQAQRRISFPIVMPAGMPDGTTFQYAHVISENPARIVLSYQAHLDGRYYRISVNESMNFTRPLRSTFTVESVGHPTKSWTLPMRRAKHGAVAMDIFAPGVPAAVIDRLVRANTQ